VEGIEQTNFNLETKDVHCNDTFVLKIPNEVVTPLIRRF
jgi:hypothetical protein